MSLFIELLTPKSYKMNSSLTSLFHVKKYFLAFLVFIYYTASLSAQTDSQGTSNDTSQDDSKWNFTVAPYLLFANMNGEIEVKGIPVEVDARTGDIFENLDFGMMLYFEASNDEWVLTFDALYMNLAADGETLITGRKARVGAKQLALDFKGMYRVTHWLDAGIGARINVLDGSLNVAEGDVILPGRDVSQNESWFDPLIVARATTDFGGNSWKLQMLADIGGFGLGSDLTWQLKPIVGYRFSDLFEMNLAYRWIGIDYEKGNNSDSFKYDMVISGPELGFLFHF